MGAIDRNGYRFEPEFSVISQDGAIHVYKNSEFIEEIKFNFSGKFPVLNEIEEIVDDYCDKKGI
ncbi:YbxH family protein [Bacillus sp. FJAT-27445]|uniref:YbxH family protein n=1 Tax=Bacillus sp. FJAT-27445 TaxID=1679166 RepID=UPI000743EB81|nr:YbxH family protein [Bacillus sp. FJAT-27445]